MSDLAAAYFTDTKFAPVRPLIVDFLPGIDRAALASAFAGELMARVRGRCPSSYFQVIIVLLGHAGYHSDRVWASHWRIAKKCIELFDWKVTPENGAKTVQRALAFWCAKYPILRKITDQEELLSGPGEHLWVDRGNKKKGEGQTNHYDIKGIQAYAPRVLVDALDALITGEQYKPAPPPEPARLIDLDERYPDPFHAGVEAFTDEAPGRRGAKPTVAAQADDFEDPFAEDEIPAKNTDLTGQAVCETPPVLVKKDISNIPTEPENVEMSDKYDKASRPEKAENGLASDIRFNVTNLSSITTRYSAPARRRTRVYTREVEELVRRGVDEGMALTMRTKTREKWDDDESRKWLRALLAYGDFKNAEDATVYGGGWYNAVYQNWMAGKAKSWPDEAMDAIGRVEAAYNKSAEGRGFVPPDVSAAPNAPSDAPPEPLPPFTAFDGFLNAKQAETPAAAPPTSIPTAPPHELLAAWPAVRKGAEEVFTPGISSLVVKLALVGMEAGPTGTLITLGTGMSFAKKTFDDKPQQVGMLAHLFADALGLEAKAVTVQIVVVKGG